MAGSGSADETGSIEIMPILPIMPIALMILLFVVVVIIGGVDVAPHADPAAAVAEHMMVVLMRRRVRSVSPSPTLAIVEGKPEQPLPT